MARVRWLIAAGLVALGGGSGGAAEAQTTFDWSDDDQVNYVVGNLYFLTYHEIGHLLLDHALDADQPASRRVSEADADDVATWFILPDPDEPELDEEIWAAMEGWLRSASHDETPSQSAHYPDDAERAARIACYLYGSNPDEYPELAEAFPNAIASVDCVEEFEWLTADMEDWFSERLLDEGDESDTEVSVRYAPAPRNLASAAEFLKRSEILEDARNDLETYISLSGPVHLLAGPAGRALQSSVRSCNANDHRLL